MIDKSMPGWLEQVPHIDSIGAELRVVARRRKASRRAFMGGAAALAGAAAFAAAGQLPRLRIRPASATVGNEYLNCANYDNWAGYNNNTQRCVGAAYSSSYCGTDKWFKDGVFNSVQYFPVKECGDNLTKRNAWRWTHSGTPYRCADGLACSQVTCSFVICSAANP